MLSPANEQHENPFISTPVLVNNSAMIEPDLDLTGQSTTKPTPVVPVADHNSIQPVVTTSTYTGEDTLDEPVTVTIVK